MENYINITQILSGVVTIAIFVLGFFVVPWIKSKLTKSQWDNLTSWADVLVRAYEMIVHGTTGLGAERREKVMTKLQELCNKHGYDFSEDELRAALEAAVEAMNSKKKENSEDMKTA